VRKDPKSGDAAQPALGDGLNGRVFRLQRRVCRQMNRQAEPTAGCEMTQARDWHSAKRR